MNTPMNSKINSTALVIQIIGVVAAFNLIPPAAEEHLVEITMIALPFLIQVFRTWFTGDKP